MQIRCPSCLVAFDSAKEVSWSDLSCPSCGESFSLSGVETTCTYRPGFEVLGRFVLLEEVGAGRFGSVWKAHDTQLQRNVALKIPRQRELDPRQTELFLRDARAVAQLKHPRIASVHEVGRQGDTVYIVTDFIDGANLHEWLTGQRLTAREAAELMIKIAEAVHHAHEAGVVHRDLKPSNIMMDRNGEPYVIDFGLARREIGDMTMTVDGQVLGTPAYMSPEQARGEGHYADRRSDTYSLGVILFRLLTGELPFRGQTRMLIFQILEHEPPNPRQLDAAVPRDLATITLKCLEKSPEKRYPSAGELSDDLKRYVAGEPIRARPVGPLERGWRWCKRHPQVASLSAALLLMLLAISIIAPFAAVQRERLKREVELRQVLKAHNLFQRASEEYSAGRLMKGIALLSSAYAIAGTDSSLRGSILNLLSGWDSQGPRPIVTDDAVVAAALSPDGHTALIGGHNSNRVARLWDVPTLTPLGQPLPHEDSVRGAAFSHNGKLALTGSADGAARLWDAETGRLLRTFQHAKASTWAVTAVAVSPDGSTIATGGNDGAQLWNAKTGELLGGRLKHDIPRVFAVAFSPDGRFVATGGDDGTARMWDVESQRPAKSPIDVGSYVYAVAFTPDGTKIATASALGMIQVWDAVSLEPIGAPLRHRELVFAPADEAYAVACSPDGVHVLSGSFDHTARLWDIQDQPNHPVGEPLRHGGLVMSVAFGPDGDTALTGSADRTARLWQLHDGKTLPHGAFVRSTAFSPDGRFVVTGSDDATARLWNARSGGPIGKAMEHGGAVLAVAVSPDGNTVLTGGDDQRLRRWSARTGEELAAQGPWDVGGAVRRIDFCSDGTTLLVECATAAGQTVQLWEFPSGKARSNPLHLDAADSVVASSPDGRMVLVLRADRDSVQLVDLHDGNAGKKPLLDEDVWRRKEWTTSAAFSGDSRFLVTGTYDQKVRLWNAETGESAARPFSHDGVVNAVAYGRDGRTILSGSDDKTARLWDVQLEMALGQPLQHAKPVTKVALSPDGGDRCRLALTICSDGSAYLWDVASGKPLARPLQYETAVTDGTFNTDGSVILFQCKDGSVRLYSVPRPAHGDPDAMRSWARARTGYVLDDQGALRQLTQAEWLQARAEWLSAQRNAATPEVAP